MPKPTIVLHGFCMVLLCAALTAFAQPTADDTTATTSPPDSAAHAEFQQRLAALAEDDVDARMQLADWAKQQGLTWDAADVYASILHVHHDDEHAYQFLSQITDGQTIPEDADLRSKLHDQFPAMKFLATDHFLIVYDTNENLTRNMAALLEKTHDVFFMSFKRIDYNPIPLTHRLLCIYFASLEDYQKYSQKLGYSNFPWGFYDHATNQIIFYDARYSPSYKQNADRIADDQKQADDLRQQIRDAGRSANRSSAADAARKLSSLTQDITRGQLWLNNLARQGNVSATIHESVFQLSYNTGIQDRKLGYPFWITQGIATNFETDDYTKPFGPFYNNRFTGEVRKLQADDKLIPLDELIVYNESNMNDDAFSESWALFNFLCRYHREQLQQYLYSFAKLSELQRDNKLNGQDSDPDAMRQQFIDAFGEPASLNDQFMMYLKRLP
jgi:Protein of unknown function (DUF1570)